MEHLDDVLTKGCVSGLKAIWARAAGRRFGALPKIKNKSRRLWTTGPSSRPG